MTHLAVDLALGTTGVCWGPGPHDFLTLTCPSKLAGGERLSWWRRHLAEHLDEHKVPRVRALVVEGPFMHHAHPNGAVATIKLHGAVEHMAYVRKVRYVEVPPAMLKRHATDRGNATKVEMLAAAQRDGFDGDDHNAADAWLLWRFYRDVILRERTA